MESRHDRGESARRTFTLVVTLAVLALAFLHRGVPLGLLDLLRPGLENAPAAAGAGGAGSYRFSAHQVGHPEQPVTYDRCRPIHVVLNPDGAPPLAGGVDSVVREAVARIRRASSLPITLDGHTGLRPRPTLSFETLGGQDARVLVTFATPQEFPGLAGNVVGLGGSAIQTGPSGFQRYVGGQVELDRDSVADIAARPGGRDLVRAILMHELGHVVGLGHVDDRGEIMSTSNAGRTTFGPGDLRGLAVVGGQPCG